MGTEIEAGSAAQTGIVTTPTAPPGLSAAAGPQIGGPKIFGDDRRWKNIIEAANRHAEADAKKWDPFRKAFASGAYEETEDQVVNNFSFPFVTMLLAALFTESPTIECDPREGSGEADQAFTPAVQAGVVPSLEDARRLYADTLEQVLTFSYERAGTGAQNAAALQDALLTGLAWTEESWDPARCVDRADFLARHEVYPDPNARFEVRDCRWICKTSVMPLAQAREFFAAKGCPQKIEPNYTLMELTDWRGALAKENAPSQSGDKDFFKFYTIYVKNPQQNFLVFRGYNLDKTLWQMPWPLTLDRDDFPFTPVKFNQSNQQINDAFCENHVVAGLRVTYQRLMEFCRRWTERAIGQAALIDDDLSDETVEKLKRGTELALVRVPLKGGKKLSDLVHKIDFSAGGCAAALELAEKIKAIVDEITGQDELLRGAVTHDMTAEEARIRADFGELRSGRRGNLWDACLANQFVHRAQIARQLMPAQQVQKIAGQQAAILWELHAADPEDFLAEYSLRIGAGSTGLRNKQMKFTRLQQLQQVALQTNQAVGQPVFDVVHIALEMSRQYTRNPERFLTQPGVSGGAAQQIMSGGAGLPPAAAGAGGPAQAGPPAAQAPAAAPGLSPTGRTGPGVLPQQPQAGVEVRGT